MNSKGHYVDIYLLDGIIGHKNIDCPNYERCLDKYASMDKDYWLCNGCNYEYEYVSNSRQELIKYIDLYKGVFFFENENENDIYY